MGEPSAEADWERWERILAPLCDAGWEEIEEDTFREWDDEHGAVLAGVLARTGVAWDVEFLPGRDELHVQPLEHVAGPTGFLPTVGEQTRIIVDADDATDVFATLGLLDATRVELGEDSDVSLRDFLAVQVADYVLGDAADHRELTSQEVAAEIDADPYLPGFLRIVGFIAPDVLPDIVPAAVTLGIAAWCWRNDTAVERWHVADDVTMARVNMAVTKAVAPHVDLVDGIDWTGVETALTDPAWVLPDGRPISALFGEGWEDVRETVRERLREWRRIDDEVLGPRATLRLLTMGGSGDHTRHWWGQGRWLPLVRAVVTDAVAGGVPVPAPYDTQGADALLADLREPDLLDDAVLDWLIDMPAAGRDGPRGLRMHRGAAAPTIRVDL